MCLTNVVQFNVTTGFYEDSTDTQSEEAKLKLTENNGKAYLTLDGHIFLTVEDMQHLTKMLELHQKRIDVK